MPATRRSASGPRATEATRQRYEQNNRVVDSVAKSLETAQADLAAIRGSLGTGAGDLRKDIARLLRDARRDVTKLSRSLRRDLERVQKDLASAAMPSQGRARRGTRASTSTTSRQRSRGAASARRPSSGRR